VKEGTAVFALSNVRKRLWEKLQRRAYRQAYLAEHVRRGIAYQIRALRDQRGWKQGEFSKRLDKPQSVVCRLEDPNYGKVTVQTLLEVANVFDVALEVRFVPYSSFVLNTRDVSSSAMHVPSFDDEPSPGRQSRRKNKSHELMSSLRNRQIRPLPANPDSTKIRRSAR
jgi:transcriptional regulator with XRE-family HTH domain